MAIAVEHKCPYCVAGHTLAGTIFFKSSEEQLTALRNNTQLPLAKFDALRAFALQMRKSNGRVTARQLKAFLDAGYTRAQALDVVANIAAKVMSNFANQLAKTPIDDASIPFAKGLPFQENYKVIRR
jgi:alkylhydroperoxidase family enzyme